MSVDYAVNLWLDRGCPKDKLVMGMGTYGRTFTLVNKAKTGLNADASGPGAAGPSTSAKGFLSYYEICDFVKNKGWTSEFIDEIKSPIAYNGKHNFIFLRLQTTVVDCTNDFGRLVGPLFSILVIWRSRSVDQSVY